MLGKRWKRAPQTKWQKGQNCFKSKVKRSKKWSFLAHSWPNTFLYSLWQRAVTVTFLYLSSPIFSNNLKREIVQHPSKYHLTRNFRRNLQFKTKSKDFLAIGKIFENKISSLEFMRALLKHEYASVLKVICFSCKFQMSSEDKSSCALGGVS